MGLRIKLSTTDVYALIVKRFLRQGGVALPSKAESFYRIKRACKNLARISLRQTQKA